MKLDKLRALIDRSALKNPICLVICFLAGALGSLPYFVEWTFAATFVSLTVLFTVIYVRVGSKRMIFLPVYLYFFGFYLPVYSFLSELYPFSRFGFSEDQAVFVLVCACVLIPLYHSLLRTLVMLIAKAFAKRRALCVPLAAVFTLSESTVSIGTLAFPWAGVPVSLTGFLPYLQTSSLLGPLFITFITAIICSAAAMIFTGEQGVKRFAAVAASVFLINTACGTAMYFIPAREGETVTAALIQGNVDSNEKWDPAKTGEIFDKYVALSCEAAKNGAKLIVLPETAIPITFTEGGTLYKAFSDIAKEYGATVVAGVSTSRKNDKKKYNSVVAILPSGEIAGRYDKRHLVPFGEFIPFAGVIGKLFPFVAEFNESSYEYGSGKNSAEIETPQGIVGPIVCFDSIFPQYAAETVGSGAEAIVIVTNDSWFGDSVGIYTHLRHAKLRAIETRTPVLRAANTGVSAFIKPNGVTSASSGALCEEVLIDSVTLTEGATLFAVIGNTGSYVIFAVFMLLYALSLLIISKFKRSKNGKISTASNRDL